MAELLKNMFNRSSLHELGLAIKQVYQTFQIDKFLESIMDETWINLELKERGRKISVNLGKYLPSKYNEAINIINQVLVNYDGAGLLCFPDFVEVYGQDEINWDLSMNALELYTQYASSEFAVRPFIIKNEERMMAQMYTWSRSDNEHIRRLASEGCRPQLPWGQALVKYKNDPMPILPILEQLKEDPSLYVRKSVANNLNDISKTHPDLIVEIANDWYGKNPYTDWILKHGCRTLLKRGNREVLAIFGCDDNTSVSFNDFILKTTSIKIGDNINFSFSISSNRFVNVRLEYAIDYMKFNNKISRKIFQISEITLKENEKKMYSKKHSFADLSTRKHYPGIHSIAIIINGKMQEKLDFELIT